MTTAGRRLVIGLWLLPVGCIPVTAMASDLRPFSASSFCGWVWPRACSALSSVAHSATASV